GSWPPPPPPHEPRKRASERAASLRGASRSRAGGTTWKQLADLVFMSSMPLCPVDAGLQKCRTEKQRAGRCFRRFNVGSASFRDVHVRCFPRSVPDPGDGEVRHAERRDRDRRLPSLGHLVDLFGYVVVEGLERDPAG